MILFDMQQLKTMQTTNYEKNRAEQKMTICARCTVLCCGEGQLE